MQSLDFKLWYKKLFAGLATPYGVVKALYLINYLHVAVENLTCLVDEGFDTLTVETKALRTVALQNRLGLDYALAACGGLCHVIGQQCYTYIPDNMTDIHSHLNQLFDKLHSEHSPPSEGLDLWSWLTTNPLTQKLISLLLPTVVVLALLCLFMSCIVPCLRSMLSKLVPQMVSTEMAHYQPLTNMPDQYDDTAPSATPMPCPSDSDNSDCDKDSDLV